MDELNACAECGFTTSSAEIFTSHIEQHEEEHNRSSSGDLSHAQVGVDEVDLGEDGSSIEFGEDVLSGRQWVQVQE
ncbi:hypothetical protein TELCIR_10907 [Teladorsagia circumcincta]|uniref:Uncharacterized protein n=1 Tax=Teladorsagia circumcincta TaxID=45464 RepID=A0A2G9UAU0_TELCI|nr:hypothetical protein TELCIR_10907 [Teladorsagia circumcincta]